MKLRKGTLVEVLRRENDLCGSWFSGKIVSADGDSYIVRYKLLTDQQGKQVVEKVVRKDVRPLPPCVNGKDWAVGDIAEVFDNRCWRVGKVAKVLKKNNRFVIKFFGSIQLKEFHSSSLRIRQAWHGCNWMLMDKGKDFTSNFSPQTPNRGCGLLLRTSMHTSKNLQAREKNGQSMRAKNKGYVHQCKDCNTDQLFGRNLKKRKSTSSPSSRGCDESLKRRVCFIKQVGDISCQRLGVDEKFTIQSMNKNSRPENTTSHCLHVRFRPAWSTEDNDQCSVASCSYNGVGDFVAAQISCKSSPDNSDAESSFPSPCGKTDLARDKVVDIHELELHAYKSTLQALYASGPLTWEQESMLTNLRISLNVSDEEHLVQVRHLLSAQLL